MVQPIGIFRTALEAPFVSSYWSGTCSDSNVRTHMCLCLHVCSCAHACMCTCAHIWSECSMLRGMCAWCVKSVCLCGACGMCGCMMCVFAEPVYIVCFLACVVCACRGHGVHLGCMWCMHVHMCVLCMSACGACGGVCMGGGSGNRRDDREFLWMINGLWKEAPHP